MIKKHLSLFLVFIMLSTFMAVSAFAEGEDISSPAEGMAEDVSKYSEAIDTLKRFGIIDEEFDPSKAITRAEFVTMAMGIMGADFSSPAETEYADVTAETPHSGAIAAASAATVISGYADGNFYPDKTLLSEEAAKILVNLLGYKAYAESYGGYPGGYLTVAAMQGLLKNVPVGDYVECSGAIAAQLVYNALDVDILQSETYPVERYYTVEGENPMTKWLDIFKIVGIVNANEYSTLTALGGVKPGSVMVGDMLLLTNGTDISDYLGYPVEAYYKKGDNDNAVMKFNVSVKVEENEILACDIDPSTTKRKLVYYYDDTTNEEINIKENPIVIYNGKLYTKSLDDGLLKPDDGRVKLADTDGDSVADIVAIEEAEIYVVSRISAQNGSITDKYGKPTLNIDVENKKTELKITKDGEEITLSDIKVNDVLAVTKSEDNLLVKITATSDKYRGKITEKSDDMIYIDGDGYKLVESNKAELEKLQVGDYSLFYFTPDYLLAGYGAVSVAGEGYGYIIAAEVTKEGFDKGKTASCRMFTSAGGVETYTLGAEVTLNGGGKKTGADIVSQLSDGGKLKAQLIKFATSPLDNKLITTVETYISNLLSINTASGATTGQNVGTGSGAYREEFSLDAKYASSGSAYKYYDEQTGILDDLYDLNGAQIFSVPSDSMWDDFNAGKIDLATIERAFSNIDTAAQWSGSYKIYNFEVYDVDEQGSVAVVLEPGAGGSGDAPKQELFIFDYFGEGMDSEGYPTKIIKGLYKGEEVSIPVNENSDSFTQYPQLLNLRRGDAIRIAIDANGNVSNLIKVFTFNPYMDANYSDSYAEQIREMNYSAGAEGSHANVGNRNYYLLNPYYYNEFNGGDTCESNPNMSWRNIGSSIWAGMMHRIIHCRISGLTSSKFMLDLGKNIVGEKMPTKLIPISGITNYYIYDAERDEISIGTIGDIDPDNPMQSVVIRIRYTVPGEIYIINQSTAPTVEPVWLGRYWQARPLLDMWTQN